VFAKIVQSKQTKHVRVFSSGTDHRLLRSLVNRSSLSDMLLPRAAAAAACEKVGQNILCADVPSKVSSMCAKTTGKTAPGGKVSGIDS
jgi:hypothetical protein